MREPQLSTAGSPRAAYEAKAAAELGDADSLVGLPAGAVGWEGPLVGARIAFCVRTGATGPDSRGLLDARVGDAVSGAAEAFGVPDAVFTLATRPTEPSDSDSGAEVRVRRVRLALEAIDPPVVIALDHRAAVDLAAAFGLESLQAGTAVRVGGRALGSVGDFGSSLDDPRAKASAWSAMKATAALGGIDAKGRPKAPLDPASKPGVRRDEV